MHAVIHNHLGRIHHAAGHPDIQKTRPTYAFIPELFFNETGLDRCRYLASPWPSINCSANPLAVGSHVIPDPARPTSIKSKCPILREFLDRLAAIVPGKAAA